MLSCVLLAIKTPEAIFLAAKHLTNYLKDAKKFLEVI
jgi:hypothetical protein